VFRSIYTLYSDIHCLVVETVRPQTLAVERSKWREIAKNEKNP